MTDTTTAYWSGRAARVLKRDVDANPYPVLAANPQRQQACDDCRRAWTRGWYDEDFTWRPTT